MMSAIKPTIAGGRPGPSILALLVDDISKMSASEQRQLWMQLNRERLSSLARQIDASSAPHNLSSGEIDSLINEARKNGRKNKKKKG